MIRLYPEQLTAQLHEGLRGCYLVFGSDPLLLQESLDSIKRVAQQHEFSEHFSFILDPHTDWDAIFSTCQALSLFASRQSLLLILPENGPNAAMSENLVKLSGLLHPDILLILRGHKLTKAQENSAWFKALAQDSVYINCLTPEQAQLPRWVSQRAKSMKLTLDEQATQLICYCYEGNLLALSQALERLSLLYPDGKLTLPRVESAVNDAAHFTPFHWLDALLAGKSKRAWHILQQLQQEDCEPVILLRTLQRELLQLLALKRRMSDTPLRTLFDQQKVWQNRRDLLTQALQRLSLQQLQQAVRLLTQVEITLKQDYGQPVWSELESLAMLLCGKALPEAFI
ncbi:DNA polymerase III subunit delta [Pectobacterium aroidearum]|jgi:DNA polymerase-3 subunit delta|uniref:DNA polymerase III subunit delta n=2 Tax=Pectobacterium TaxID=122277 RepID=A0ABR5ZGL7_9GAMM|nr:MULTISPECIES: DNA polymerase III subunit delta [Pectobacterium]ACT12233.1 DNA polymerase III, delta subunit [Pectobacterium carotovorum subsp. carotovorum PC1]MBA0205223.1 DNA polymerase III subunit delta [Pectobacterium aroidearum]MBA5200926.1 DNA polymerase III subunit delta [Pectobacterium aroidearum]MBA5229308.1 DNA polymerase III subunit delta [Pectobacterium aroidearum]MBA5233718.1 DNA polymerase III subunit delta [Pectobacterium aroidearum]